MSEAMPLKRCQHASLDFFRNSASTATGASREPSERHDDDNKKTIAYSVAQCAYDPDVSHDERTDELTLSSDFSIMAPSSLEQNPPIVPYIRDTDRARG